MSEVLSVAPVGCLRWWLCLKERDVGGLGFRVWVLGFRVGSNPELRVLKIARLLGGPWLDPR